MVFCVDVQPSSLGGTYARILGHYVRTKVLELDEALRKRVCPRND
jgi:hypothetical protein